jgi:catalase
VKHMVPSQFDRSETLVTLIQGIVGVHPTRTVHAAGDIYRGTFTPTAEAKGYTRAVHFNGAPVPATVRFSTGGGSPDAPNTATAGMATKFYLPDGRVTDLICLNSEVFVVSSVDQICGLLATAEPDPATGQIDMAKVQQFVAAHPNIAAAFAMRAQVPIPVSLAQTNFHAIHVFRFINAEGAVHHIRYHWTADLGLAGLEAEKQKALPHNYLFTEMRGRLGKGPVSYTLWFEIGEDGDPINDPSAPWGKDRKRVKAGRLELVAETSIEEIGDPVMMHDPTRITDGIELTDDPIIEARRGAYEVSVAHRTGGWRACPFAKVAEDDVR